VPRGPGVRELKPSTVISPSSHDAAVEAHTISYRHIVETLVCNELVCWLLVELGGSKRFNHSNTFRLGYGANQNRLANAFAALQKTVSKIKNMYGYLNLALVTSKGMGTRFMCSNSGQVSQ
jgi:hypothetical protein